MSRNLLWSDLTRQSQNEKDGPENGGERIRHFSRDIPAPKAADKKENRDDNRPNSSQSQRAIKTYETKKVPFIFHERKDQSKIDGNQGKNPRKKLLFPAGRFSQALAREDANKGAEKTGHGS
jgi:hypothetical protein